MHKNTSVLLYKYGKIRFMKLSKQTVISTVLTVLLLAGGIFIYTRATANFFMDNVKCTVKNELVEKASVIESFSRYCQSSIKLISQFLTTRMTSPEVDDPNKLFAQYTENSPFDFLMYVRADGTHMANALPGGKPFNASSSLYYTEGMKGKTGVCINYRVKDTEKTIITFYTPLYYANKITGVICGDIDTEISLEKKLCTNEIDVSVYYVLCDREMKVIASSSDVIPSGLDINRYADNTFISDILTHVKEKNTETFSFTDEGKKGLCAVAGLNYQDWKLIAIVLPKTLNASVFRFAKNSIYLIIYVFVILILYFVIRIYYHDKDIKKNEYEKFMENMIDTQATQISILSSFSGIYYSAYLLDLNKDTLVEIKSEPELRDIIDKKKSLKEFFDKIVRYTIVPEYLDKVIAFTDLSTLPARLKDKKIISIECQSCRHGWLRVSYITVETDERHVPYKVLYVAQIIDDEKRREEALINSAYNDELTGLYNRRSYEDDLAKLKASPITADMVYISFDVNGLKVVNDTLGHEAGDELICGAADCMTFAFGTYGKVYRTGGDEFQAILYCNSVILDSIKQKFEKAVDSWTGKLVSELKISAGYVNYSENPEMSVNEIVKLADQRMYKAKSEFYTSKSVDRRGQQAAFEVLCQAYTKILKIDLLKDEYTILQMREDEKDQEKGFSPSISLWLENFAKSGQVHADDVAKYLEKTNINYLRRYFSEGNKMFSIHYRRIIGDKICTVIMEMIPARNYGPDNQIIYLYVKNIDIA